MNEYQPIASLPEDEDLVSLVSQYLDQQLDEREVKMLEEKLQSNPMAMRYCAEQICQHARLHDLSSPLRINIHEGRDLVIEQSHDQSVLTTKTVNQVTLGAIPPSTKKVVTLPEQRAPLLYWCMVSAITAASVAGICWWILANTPQNKLVLRPLENASFESGEANDGRRGGSIPGWKRRGSNSAVVLNPSNLDKANPYGQAHLVRSYSEVDGKNLLVINHTDAGALGWVKQKLYSETPKNPAALQLVNMEGMTLRVSMLVGRPQKEAGTWINPVNLRVSIQEEDEPFRSAAEYRIDTGSSTWSAADIDLALGYDEFKRVSFDLKVQPEQMRGSAYLVIEADSSTARESEVFIDQIEVRIIE